LAFLGFVVRRFGELVDSVKQKMRRLGLLVGTRGTVVPTTTSPARLRGLMFVEIASSNLKLVSEDVCPACGEEMVRCAYRGKRHIAKNVGAVDYKAWFVDDEFDESGEPNYVEVVGGRGLE
jgi:hypothetical protein